MYQPRISNENVRRLYQLKLQKKIPMTHVLDQILNDYFEFQKAPGTDEQKKIPKQAI